MYTVIELQTTGEQTGVLTYSYAERDDAEQKYHLVLSAAAKSSVEFHSAIMLDEKAYPVKRDSYTHKE